MGTPEYHMLVVDDFSDALVMCRLFLSLRGVRVTLASDGQEAIDKAAQHRPHLIHMDLSLPVVSGWEATRRLKADERTKHIPIVMLTASPLSGLTPALAEAGFEAVLIKPCLPDQMVAEIVRILEAGRSKNDASAGDMRAKSAGDPC